MKVSTKGRYAVRALTYLALSYNGSAGKPVSIKEISDREKISNRYLENIFVKLRKSGVVTSLKGEKGGFLLSRSPEKISIYDILKAVENDIAASRCAVDMKACENSGKCGIRKIWVKLDRHVNEFLSGTSLADATEMHHGK
jgi:Rrf2 family protein